MRFPLLLAGAVAVLPLVGAHRAPAAPAASVAPVVLVLHGRGMLGRDTGQLRREWTRALRDGANAAGDSAAGADIDLRLVWYADALDPVGTRMAAGCAASSPPAAGSAVAEETGVRGLLGLMGGILSIAAAIDTLGGSPLRAMAGDLLYFSDDQRRCAAATRLDDAFRQAARERRPVVLVAHSFGSFVAYDYLRDRERNAATDPVAIARFVTLGSLLGAREVRTALFPGTERLVAIRGVGEWINVIDRRDPLARPFGDEDAAAARNVVVSGLPALDPHEAASYLRDPATARAILGAAGVMR